MDWSDLMVETTRLAKAVPDLAPMTDAEKMGRIPGTAMISLNPTGAHVLVFVNEAAYTKFTKDWIEPVMGHQPTFQEVYDLVGIPKSAVQVGVTPQ